MNISQVLELFQVTLVPVVMISGCGLVSLIVQNRYTRIVDRIRVVHERSQGITSSESERYQTRLRTLAQRGRYLKWALFSIFSSISCFVSSSFFILLNVLMLASDIQLILVIASFWLGMALLTVGSWLVVLEIGVSFKTVLVEAELV